MTSFTVTVNKVDQSISFQPLPAKTYGDPSFTLGATASSGLPVSFSVLSGPASLSGNILTITGAGTVVVDASQAGNASYNPAADIRQSFIVAPARLTITADNQTKVYGQANPTLTASYSGFVNGDTPAGLAAPVSLATAATAASPVGSYAITASGASSADYVITFFSGTLAVTPATPTVAVGGSPFPYDGTPHAASATATGVGGVIVSGSFTFTYNGSPTPPTNAGTYAVVATFTSSDSNYANATGNGSITINPATPTVNVIGGSFLYDGQPHPATGSVVGVNGADLGTPLFTYTDSSGASVTAPINPGTYQVVGSFSGNVNYTAASGIATVVILPSATFAAPLAVGYWKNHPNAWPVKMLTLGGYTYSQSELLAILNTPPSDDARVILAQQLIAAKLNLANGSNPAPIRATIDYTDSLMAGLGKISVTSRKVKVSSSLGQLMVHTAAVSDDYNQGLL